MSLSSQAVERLFERLGATYGSEWRELYAGVTVGALKAAWAHELAEFEENLHAIAWALEHLPERCPNLIRFKNLCRQAPRPKLEAVEDQREAADPERVKAELRKLGYGTPEFRAPATYDHRGWARSILAREKAGERVPIAHVTMARSALASVLSHAHQ